MTEALQDDNVWDGKAEIGIVRRTNYRGQRFLAAIWAKKRNTLVQEIDLVIAEWKIKYPNDRYEVVPMPQEKAVKILKQIIMYGEPK
jgi:hypothetical protein